MTPKKRRSVRLYPDLATFLAETGTTQVWLARRVGTTQAHISRITNGDAIPRSFLAMRLAKECRVPLDSFTRVYLAKHALRVA